MKSTNEIIRFLKDFVLPNKRKLITCCLLLIISSVGDLYVPFGIKLAIDNGISNKDLKQLIFYIILFLIVTSLTLLIKYTQNIKVTELIKNVSFGIKFKTIKCLQTYELSFYSKHNAGEITSIIERDVEQIEGLSANVFLVLVVKSFTLITILITLIFIQWKVALYVILVSPILTFFQYKIGKFISKQTLEIRQSVGKIQDFTQDIIENMLSIKVLNYTSTINDKYRKTQVDFINKNIKITALTGIIAVVGQAVNIIGIILVLYTSGLEVIGGSMTVGLVMSLLLYVQRAYDPLLQIMQSIVQIQNSKVILKRIYSLIDSPEVVKDGPYKILSKLDGEIEFLKVGFSYDGRKVFDNMNFKINSGKITGIIGSNGTGKSTIARIIARLCNIEEGKVMIDGLDINQYCIEDLRDNIMYIPANSCIFSGTIKENILLDRVEKYDDKALWDIIEFVGLSEDIKKMEHGLETMLGSHSTGLSTGQCQKISIARALVKNPPVLILDEPTASFDSEFEKEITIRFKDFFKDKTVIIISHRPEILRICDTVILLENNSVKVIEDMGEVYANQYLVN